jgi:hypothetical protein
MVARVWGILGVIAFAAFVVGSLLAGASLILYGFGAWRGQLAVAGIAEILLSLVFLIAGAGALFTVSRVSRDREPFLGRLVFAVVALFAGSCWLIIGVRGIVWPTLLRAAFGSN